MNRRVAFFNTSIEISYSSDIGEFLFGEFDWLPATEEDPDLSIELQAGFKSPPDSGVQVDDRVWVNDSTAFVDYREHNALGDKRYQILLEMESDPANVVVYYDPKLIDIRYKPLYEAIKRGNWNYISRPRIVADNILYDVFEPLIHQQMIQRNAGYIHASSVTKKGEGVIFTGWGGAGKTSTCVELVNSSDWSFASDDLSIIGGSGKMLPYTKSMQVYPYNLGREPDKVFAERGPVDRLQWDTLQKLKGKKGVRRRVSPAQYFGEPDYDASGIDLTKVFYLIREERDDIVVTSGSSDTLSERAAATISHEFEEYVKMMWALTAAGPGEFMSYEEFIKQSKQVYANAFDSVDDLFLVHIPIETPPEELAGHVARELL